MINFLKLRLNELVNSDGTRIGANNVKLSVDNSKSSSDSTMDPIYDDDGEQIRNSVVGSTRQQGYRGYYSLVPMPAVKTPLASVYTASANIDYMDDEQGEETEKGKKYTKERLKKASKKKMDNMVEAIVSKNFPKEVVDKIKKYGDINQNGIPDIDVISEENPLLVRKVKNLIDIVEKNQATGEQKGVILNYLINKIGMVDVPAEYKQELLKTIR